MINYHTLFIAFLLRLALGNYVKLNFDVFLDSANLYMYGGSHNDLYIWTIDTEAKYTRISNALYETTDSHSETKVFKGEMTMYLREGEVKGELYEDKFFFDEDKSLFCSKIWLCHPRTVSAFCGFEKLVSLF